MRERSALCGGIALGFLLAAPFVHAGSPVVTNVVASQRANTKLVDIHYDALDTDNDALTVRVEISHNDGRTFEVPALSFSGDIGANVMPGTNRLIVWNAGIDWDGEYSPSMRVKVIASDGKGFPEMEWGMEVPPGGFLMGQDGGPEGAGPSRHINIPWSFWLSKYEITVSQYVDFLNMAFTAGEVYRDATKAYAKEGRYTGVPGGSMLVELGPDIQWSISRFTTVALSNLPVQVSWYGAVAFAQHYGYDLPTDAEWEKAARGADYDGAGEHRVYPWGNILAPGNANFLASGDPFGEGRTPVGYFNGNQTPAGPDVTNAYALYDVIGNLAEWTRTLDGTIETYPQLESITNAIHALEASGSRMVRGGSYRDAESSPNLKCYGRTSAARGLVIGYGFRVIRRSPGAL